MQKIKQYSERRKLTGSRELFVRENHNRLTWTKIIQQIALEKYSEAEKITIVQDNLAAHKPSALYEKMSAEKSRWQQFTTKDAKVKLKRLYPSIQA